MGTIVEACHDDRGIIWPESVAPFRIHLVTLKGKTEESQARIEAAAQSLYDELLSNKVEVLWDDREASPGEKLADADLLGLPIRVLISEKTMAEGAAEVKRRSEGETMLVKMENLLPQLAI